MNILVLTSNYPALDLPKETTRVVHYFTKEWVKMGHNVLVIHNQTIFPKYLYPILKFFSGILSSKVGYVFSTEKPKEIRYEIDGVTVYRRNIIKLFPHAKYTNKSYNKQLKKIINILTDNQFIPDAIVAHWMTPQLYLLYELKKIFPTVPITLTSHGESSILIKHYGKKSNIYLNSIDKIAFRSERVKRLMEKSIKITQPTFMCYSGVPESYINSTIKREFSNKLSVFTYTGTLIARKHPESLIMALKDYSQQSFCINYIGEGREIETLSKLITEYRMEHNVHLLGRIPREKVVKILEQTECFIMISKFETFGLVYLEAMAKGCITIASKNEGMDGIIQDGVNGFLCTAGDWKELKQIINHINTLSPEEKTQISLNAQKTAADLTDAKVANRYLDFILPKDRNKYS